MKKLVLNKAMESFNLLAEQQELKRTKKYGQELDALDFKYDWLQMAQEELVNGYKYFEAERMRRKFIIGKIEKILEVNTVTVHIRPPKDLEIEIKDWLQLLNGETD